ncbi:MAG: hypothetical protein ACTSSL_12310 [Candidatus Heimdallarchaeaceae archaeon]
MVENNFLNNLNSFLKEFSLESSKIMENINFFFLFFNDLNVEIEKSNFSEIDKKLVSYSFEAFDLTLKKPIDLFKITVCIFLKINKITIMM